MEPATAALEEFKALRAEMLALYSRRSIRLTVAWAGVASLLLGGVYGDVPELGAIALMLISSGWMDEISCIDAMIRLGIHIELIIEPRVDGLQWQRMKSLIEARDNLNPPFSKRLLHAVYSRYGIFTMVSILGTVLIIVKSYPLNVIRYFVLIFFMIFAILYLVLAFKRAIQVPFLYAKIKSSFLPYIEVFSWEEVS